MSLKRKLGDLFIKYRLRVGRGSVFTSELEGLKNALAYSSVLILTINQYFHWLAPLWVLPVAWLAQKIFEYLMGWYDEKVLGWWAAENQYVTVNTNPFLVSMDKKLDEIKANTEKN